MAKIVINQESCKGCMLCINYCPKKLIRKSSRFNGKGSAVVEFFDQEPCMGCSMCAVICPDCCIEVFK